MRAVAGGWVVLLSFLPGVAWAQLPAGGGPGEPPRHEDRAPERSRQEAHLLVVVETSPEETRVRFSRRVGLPLPEQRHGTWRVEVLDGAGAVLHTQPLVDPSVLRSEFHGTDEIEGTWVRLATAAFALRLPLLDRAVRVRVLAPASQLPEGDVRAGDAAPNAFVEVGSFALPEVE